MEKKIYYFYKIMPNNCRFPSHGNRKICGRIKQDFVPYCMIIYLFWLLIST